MDFIVLDIEEDEEISIILGLSFLATGRTLIDVQKGELVLRFQNKNVVFNVFKAMNYHQNLIVVWIEKEIQEIFDIGWPSDPLEACLV